MPNVQDQKTILRKKVLAKRDALDPALRIEASIKAAEHAAGLSVFEPENLEVGTVVSAFLPIRSEIDLRPLMTILADRRARLCLPVVQDRTTIIFRELVRGAELVDTGFGTVGPSPEAPVLDPSVLFMPLSAFDARGGRMGYGAGHYDRAIERLRNKAISPRLIGAAFAVQQVDEVPLEEHDQLLEGIITERGFIAAEGHPS